MLHSNKQDASNSVYGSNHYSSSGRNSEIDNVNGVSVNTASSKKYSSGGPAPGSEYNNGTNK